MSQAYSETCYSGSSCATERNNTAKLAAVALGTALILSLIGAYNLNRDVKIVTEAQVPYVEQRLNLETPKLLEAYSLPPGQGQNGPQM